MNISIKKVISSSLLIIWMLIIFIFSAQPAVRSAKISESTGMVIGKIFIQDYDDLSNDKQEEYAQSIDHVVRKSAHFTEYAILGMLFIATYRSFKIINYKLMAYLSGTIYAVTDEVHQLFVEGRSCQFSDMCLDSLGVLFGILMLWVILSLVKRILKR